MQRTSHHRCRGSVYVLVLGTAMIVSTIGLSTLLLARVHNHAARMNLNELKARFYGPSVVELALFRIEADANWRSTYTHDRWLANEAVGELTFTFKLVDEQDTDLANDALDPVRLYAAALVDDALRIYSIQLLPDVDLAGIPTGTMTPAPGTWRREVLP